MSWIISGIVVAVVGTLWWLRRLQPDDPARARAQPPLARMRAERGLRPQPTMTRTRETPFAAVAIRTGLESCAAAQNVASIRFLEDAAPLLPVEGCDRANCQCTFVHFADRRQGDEADRRAGIGLKSELYGSSGERERRRLHGRRITDRS